MAHLEPVYDPPNRTILAEQVTGQFKVQVFMGDPDHRGKQEPVYRVLKLHQPQGYTTPHWFKVRCWTRADERAFPKRAAAIGAAMVAAIRGDKPTAALAAAKVTDWPRTKDKATP